MRYAIYSRKSKFTGKGDSIENQIEMCQNYIKATPPEDNVIEIEIFEDEGFSGKNTNRPEFQRMMGEIKKKKFDCLVCYRLDRISRSVGDFAQIYKSLERYGVSLICINEKFDTSSSMGKAMLQIAMVFAELERETIAERIRDNMTMLARSGRWLGGTTPLGFKSAQVKSESIEGKTYSSYKLATVKEELDIVQKIFAMYLEGRSLSKVETWFINNDITTRVGKRFTPIALREILSNPVYCIADKQAYDYFAQNESDICSAPESFDGKHGVMTYNRTSNSADGQKKQPMSEWIVAVGKHKGMIPSGDWLKAQQLLENNRHLSRSYKPQNSTALLSGVLVCQNCGEPMRPRVDSNRTTEDGGQRFSYMCELKRKSKRVKCDCSNINGNQLDQIVCEELLSYQKEGSGIAQKLTMLKSRLDNGGSEAQRTMRDIDKRIADKEAEIDKRIEMLSQADKDSVLFKRVERQVDELDKSIRVLKQERFQLEQEQEESIDYEARVEQIFRALQTFRSTFNLASIADKRDFLRSVIERIEWDGEKIHIFLHGEPK